MRKICIIRHGETDWNRMKKLQGQEDIPLNKVGKEQACKVGKYLVLSNWNYIITSPLLRAYETANLIAKELKLENLKIDNNLIERNYGDASGMTLEDRLSMYPNRNYPNMEDWELMRERVYDCLLRIAEKYIGKNIILVSHGAAINSILHTLSNGEYGSGITKLHNACINMVNNKEGKLSIEYFNKKII